VEPIPETRDVLEQMLRVGDNKVPVELVRMGRRVVEIVPECVGLSLGLLRSGLTFTLVASSDDIAGLDAVQYLDGGPCVDGAHENLAVEVDDVLDERSWLTYVEASAAVGVRSSLTLPILASGELVIGTVNLYASTPDAFEGHFEDLAEALGSHASKVISNADLSFSTRLAAAEAPQRLADQNDVDVALGLIADSQRVSIPTARERLRAAASRAGITEAQAARAVRGLLQQEPPH
jgi:GAF domain-containing protein